MVSDVFAGERGVVNSDGHHGILDENEWIEMHRYIGMEVLRETRLTVIDGLYGNVIRLPWQRSVTLWSRRIRTISRCRCEARVRARLTGSVAMACGGH